MSEAKKKSRGKKALKIIGIIVAVIAVFIIVSIFVNDAVNNKTVEFAQSFEAIENKDAVVPVKDADGNWSFTTDRELKILQFTDVHLGGGWMSAEKDRLAVNAVANMVIAEKPDLVVITGDIAYPTPYGSASIDNMPGHVILSSLMETLGVYWIPTFGNHDTEVYSPYTREEVSDFYSNDQFKYCLYKEGNEDIFGYGNSVITVKNSDGIITQSIVAMDSNAYVGETLIEVLSWDYDNIHDDQIQWYKNSMEDIIDHNKAIIENMENKDELTEKYCKGNSLLFFHIPLEEYADAWREYSENGFKDTENAKLIYGTATESGRVVFSSDIHNNMFETMQSLGGNQGIFCGHDHINNFSIDYKGIRLTYGFSIDYLAYSGISKLGSQRGCTVITVKPDGTFDCVAENYYQDKYNNDMREEVTMQEFVPSMIEE